MDGVPGEGLLHFHRAVLPHPQGVQDAVELLLGEVGPAVLGPEGHDEVYYFSSNMDHYVNHDANISGGKKNKARQFLRQYGLNTTMFCDFFIGDKHSVGHVGYYES